MEENMPKKEHFIPLRQSEIVEHLANEGLLAGSDVGKFREFSKILNGMFHYESLSVLDELKKSYYPFNADPATTTKMEYPAEHKEALEKKFIAEFEALLARANFQTLTPAELDYAFSEDSDLAVNVEIDQEEFEHMLLFRRGESRMTVKVPFLGIFKRKKDIDVYDRIAMLVKFRDGHKRKKTALGMEIDPSRMYLKYFKNVPKQDIEMIFPNPRIRMRFMDKFKITVPLLGGMAFAGAKLGNFVGEGDMSVTVAATVVFTLIGYMIKSGISYQQTVIKYIKNLTQGLYFKNLDNNSGVFHVIIDEAEEEEVKEALLGYYFLLQKGNMLEETLDGLVEEWFRSRMGIEMDFEVDDALHKLERLGLASRNEQERWSVLPLDAALERLDHLWDNIFEYNVLAAPQLQQIPTGPSPAEPMRQTTGEPDAPVHMEQATMEPGPDMTMGPATPMPVQEKPPEAAAPSPGQQEPPAAEPGESFRVTGFPPSEEPDTEQ